MSMARSALLVFLVFGMVLLSCGCAGLQRYEAVEVNLAGVEPLQGEGLELRMLVKLRIQNPNDLPLDFNGVSIEMRVQGNRFATGVSAAGGSVPRFGETIVAVPMSASVFHIASQAMGALNSEYREKLAYEINGKLARPAFSSVYFKVRGEFAFPSQIFGSEK